MRPVILIWQPQAEESFRNQVEWLEANRDRKAVTHFLQEVAQALTQLRDGLVSYRVIDVQRNIRSCPANKYMVLHHRPVAEGMELLTFFDTRQNPDKLKL
ncbi:MAG: type II toxin-antitoxin system RelE/ParE family toxin [Janthinobacterium lividum]